MKIKPLYYLQAAKRITFYCADGHKLGRVSEEEVHEGIKKTAFYLVRYINTKPKLDYVTIEEVTSDLVFQHLVLSAIAQMTPKEFMNYFPIKKFYKGHKYGVKDYYTTKKMLSKFYMDEPIGDDKVIDFLWNYVNDDIENFIVNHMLTISQLRRFEGEPSLAEEIAKELGLKTYRLYQDSKGKKFLFDDETGKTIRIKERPKHLKLIKGSKRKRTYSRGMLKILGKAVGPRGAGQRAQSSFYSTKGGSQDVIV